MSTNLDFSGLTSFADLTKPDALTSGTPLSLALDLIDENPNNRRKTFDEAALQELADSIAAKGVHTPISVKKHPTEPGRYVINFGHRRFRASKLAGKAEIPAFISETNDEFDQLTENIQRDNLSAREIVAAVSDLLGRHKQAEIARMIGKSKAWVSKHAALTELPDVLSELLDTERCRDASTLYELLLVWKSDAAAVTEFLAGNSDQIVQADVEGLRAAIKRGKTPPEGTPLAEVFAGKSQDADMSASESGEPKPLVSVFEDERTRNDSSQLGDGENGGDGDGDGERQQNVKPSKAPPDPMKVKKPTVQVRVGRREGVLLIGKTAAYGLVWVQYEDASEEEIDAGKVKLIAVTDAAK